MEIVMKKHLPCLHKESGFYFVYTIWVTMLVLAVTITIITGYRLHIEEAHRLLDMTRDRDVKEELFSKKGEIKEHHQYPHGEVRVTSQMVSKSSIKLIMNIQTEHHTYEEQVYVKFNPS